MPRIVKKLYTNPHHVSQSRQYVIHNRHVSNPKMNFRPKCLSLASWALRVCVVSVCHLIRVPWICLHRDVYCVPFLSVINLQKFPTERKWFTNKAFCLTGHFQVTWIPFEFFSRVSLSLSMTPECFLVASVSQLFLNYLSLSVASKFHITSDCFYVVHLFRSSSTTRLFSDRGRRLVNFSVLPSHHFWLTPQFWVKFSALRSHCDR